MRADTGCSPPIVVRRQGFRSQAGELKLTVEPGKSVTFNYRVLILGGAATPETIEREYKNFAAVTTSSAER